MTKPISLEDDCYTAGIPVIMFYLIQVKSECVRNIFCFAYTKSCQCMKEIVQHAFKYDFHGIDLDLKVDLENKY